ncbi:HAMP domain-containing protein, partial [Acinetobacter baumannii]
TTMHGAVSRASATIAILLPLALLIAGLTWWGLGRTVVAALLRLGQAMRQLAQGDLAVTLHGQHRADEIGIMARAVQVFKDNLHNIEALR